jgi:hypothetical protein
MTTGYEPKIILAWGEAISGNIKIRDWLMKNGYKELGLFVYALNNKDSAREWLMTNKYYQLMAVINGAEGNKTAIQWLNNFGFDVLAKVAEAGGGNQESFLWLMKNNQRELALLSKKIEFVKDRIEEDNNDVHKISKE